MSTYLSDLKTLAERYGFFLYRTGKHYIWRHPDGGHQVVTPRSMKNTYRGLRNIEAELRRAAP
jgi:predicted RNA binding protein YcfA (HicA-like mRNA interferase family)